MSGWTTFTVVEKDIPYDEHESYVGEYFEDNEFVDIHTGIGRRFLDWGAGTGTYVYANTVNGAQYAAFVKISGYRDWSEDIELMRRLLNDVGAQVVIIHANDTSDTGVARLYQNTEDGFVETDRYEERQGRDGHPVGEKAASYMHFHHGVPAVGNMWRMSDYNEEDNGDML